MKTIVFCSVIFCFFSINLLAQVWEPIVTDELPEEYYISDISIVNDQVIWAVAIDYSVQSPVPASHIIILLKSSDGGNTWEVKDIEEAMGRFSWDIHAFDENTACITTQNLGPAGGRGIFRTTDGGETWLEVFNHSAGGVWLHFFDDQEGICINRQSMARTTDGGVNWTLISSGNIPAFQSGESTILNAAGSSLASFGDIFWFGTDKGRIYKSYNRGNNWTASNSGLGSNATIFSVAFIDDRNGAALYINPNLNNYQLAKTSDGGSSWNTVDLDYEFEEVIAIPCSRVFMGVSWDDNFTAISTDLGNNWSILDDQISAWVPVFQSPNLGWMANGSDDGADPALYKWVGGALYGRTYVDQNATGNNDGSSWADAYTDLQDALAAASEGSEIWVAEGVYKPGDDPESTFLINKNIHMYGGFSGSECNAADRDLELHPTILSGDFNGDDIEDDFATNRTDNAMSVVTFAANTSNEALIDGFSIQGGHADGTVQYSGSRGGGMYSDGAPIIRNCFFSQNYAETAGGALYQNNHTMENIYVGNCQFENNTSNRGGAFHNSNAPFYIRECSFKHNTTFDGSQEARGAGLRLQNSPGTVESCIFMENQAFEWGGGIDIWGQPGSNATQVEVLNCTFEKNSSGTEGGGLVYGTYVNGSSCVIKGCQFVENEAPISGGGIAMVSKATASNLDFLVDSCVFTNNISDYGSGHMGFLYGQNSNVTLTNSSFNENTTEWVGAVAILGYENASGEVAVDQCTFERNQATYSAGLSTGSLPNAGSFTYSISECDFIDNHATEYGGALDFYGESPSLMTIQNCNFQGNNADLAGGAVVVGTNHPEFEGRMSNCIFESNSSPEGAAISAFDYTIEPGITQEANITFENCLMTGNEGEGGTFNSYNIGTLKLLNCTIADNPAGGIVHGDSSTLALQNTILANPGGVSEYTGTSNETYLSSLGGNLISDLSLDAYLTTTDQQDVDPLFVAANDFHLSDESPGINAGINEGVNASYDLDGNTRIYGNIVDIGAYENQLITSTTIKSTQQLNLWPNPATHFLYIQLPESVVLPVEVNLYNSTGKMLKSQILSTDQAIDLEGLPAGVYLISIHIEDNLYIGKFTKV